MNNKQQPDYDLLTRIYEETRDNDIVDDSDRGKDLYLFYEEDEKHETNN